MPCLSRTTPAASVSGRAVRPTGRPSRSTRRPAPRGALIPHAACALAPVRLANTGGTNSYAGITAAQGYCPATRSLILNGDITLPSGDYHLCRLHLGNHYGISVASGATVTLFT